MAVVLGATSAIAAGASFAGAGVLQHWVAARTGRASLSPKLLAALGRQPLWLAGVVLATAGNGFQALALPVTPLALVQPLLVTELVFAIPISARLHHKRLGSREWRGIAAVTVGLAATVWGAAPQGTGSSGTSARWIVVGGVLVIAAIVLAAAGLRRTGEARAVLFATSAALVFALYSTLLAATVASIAADGLAALSTPLPYVTAAASLAGLLLIQSAFQAGPLAVTLPMVDWAQPLVAVVLGITVLGESLSTSPYHLTALAIGALTALAGILLLNTSPQVRSLQDAQTAQVSTERARTARPAHHEATAVGCT
jgi:drug/metabolite transporter (DMT)-like permease